MGCSAPLGDADHAAVRAVAEALARELRPGDAGVPRDLARRREAGIDRAGGAVLPRPLPPAEVQDRGRPLDRQLRGHLGPGRGPARDRARTAGSAASTCWSAAGSGMTHNKGDTTARLAEPLGFVPTEHGVEAVRIVAAIFRDHGNRSDRRHARLKYLLADWGIAALPRGVPAARVVHARAGRWRSRRCRSTTTSAATARATGAGSTACSSRAGASWTPGAHRLKTRAPRDRRPGSGPASGSPASRTCCSPTSTPTASRPSSASSRRTASRCRRRLSAARRFSMACPALPTCGLAVAESERAIPGILDQFEAELETSACATRRSPSG